MLDMVSVLEKAESLKSQRRRCFPHSGITVEKVPGRTIGRAASLRAKRSCGEPQNDTDVHQISIRWLTGA
jgi:hypothetical protein